MDYNIEVLSKYNFWDKKIINFGFIRKLYLRKIVNFLDNKLIKVLVGQRRTGKSYLLRQIINYLIEEKRVNPKNIFYFNKEFIEFQGIRTVKHLNDIFLLYLKKIKPRGKIYIFLDEIQNIEAWENFVNSYSQDFTREYEIFITGSNSRLLSGELSTLLSGRFVEFKIYPFSFQEFCEVHNFPVDKKSYLDFLHTGGMPELINFNNNELIFNYIESLKNTIILRDIVERYAIKDVNLLESLLKFISSNIGNFTSVTNIVKYYKNLGKKTNYETVSTYLKYLTETFLLYEVERYDIRGKQTLSGVKKYYLNDLSFKNYLVGFTANDIGYNLENQVFIQLLEKDYKVFVGRLNDLEIDFIAEKNNRKIYLQVAYLLSEPKVAEREFGNLQKIKNNYPKYVVTLDDLKFSDNQGIEHIRAWELGEIL